MNHRLGLQGSVRFSTAIFGGLGLGNLEPERLELTSIGILRDFESMLKLSSFMELRGVTAIMLQALEHVDFHIPPSYMPQASLMQVASEIN